MKSNYFIIWKERTTTMSKRKPLSKESDVLYIVGPEVTPLLGITFKNQVIKLSKYCLKLIHYKEQMMKVIKN